MLRTILTIVATVVVLAEIGKRDYTIGELLDENDQLKHALASAEHHVWGMETYLAASELRGREVRGH